MTDREMLELAAKAAGLNVKSYAVDTDDKFTHLIVGRKFTKEKIAWNPLTDDGDSRRLQVLLQITLECNHYFTVAIGRGNITCQVRTGDDPTDAARRAVGNVAAEIGRNME